MENKVCTKCPTILPTGYKYKKCEACRNKQVRKMKNGLKTVVSVAGTVVSIGAVVITQGKVHLKK